MKQMLFLTPFLMAVILVAGCKSTQSHGKLDNFFENSFRASGNAQARELVMAITNKDRRWCTAFWVANKYGVNLAGTALHCLVDVDPQTWCKDSRYAFVDAESGEKRHCVRVAVGGVKGHDFLIVQLDGTPHKGSGLKLAAFPPVSCPSRGDTIGLKV